MRQNLSRPSRALFIAFALAAIALLAGAFAASASAGAYDVEVCSANGQTDAFRVAGEPSTAGLEGQNTCGVPGQPRLLLLAQAGATSIKSQISATLKAPDDTFIERLKAVRATGADWPSDEVVWEVGNGRAVLDRLDAARTEENLDLQVNSTELTAALRCTEVGTCDLGGRRPIIAMRAIVATIVDITPPNLQVPNVPALEGPVKGTVSIFFRATDLGGGIRSTTLLVDGAPVATIEEPNEGRCQIPFRFLVPCALATDRAYLLDTTKLSNGIHDVVVVADDAGNLRGESRHLSLTVDNTAAPPANPPTTPTATPPTPPKAGGGMRVAPRLTGLALSRKSVKAGKRLQLRFDASEAGTLSVAITPMAGAAARGKAAKPLTTLTRAVAAGPGSIPLATRVRGKLLRPGAYGVTIRLRDADGSASEQATLRFRVLRSR
ncbi:MAG TPA: hypothetical protein VFX45_06670 [Solirubrobacterales bacterium]|nr:hypothetical protein [Solirubrobacterales bacterium]